LHWFLGSLYVLFGIVLLCVGLLFVKNAFVSLYLSKGEVAFASLVLGIVLLLVGGRLVFSTFTASIKRVWVR
jgi:hypothetical protein